MNDTTKTDILKALQTLKDECYKHARCIDCPLRMPDVNDTPACYLYYGKKPPATWDLNFADNWRAFRDTED